MWVQYQVNIADYKTFLTLWAVTILFTFFSLLLKRGKVKENELAKPVLHKFYLFLFILRVISIITLRAIIRGRGVPFAAGPSNGQMPQGLAANLTRPAGPSNGQMPQGLAANIARLSMNPQQQKVHRGREWLPWGLLSK